jgi:asparagine N-glycosylation enzyme membrane subunit Stt3
MPFNIKFSPKLVIGLLITLFFAVAMFIRIYYPYDQVFVGDWVKFTGNDAYYQMRLVDNMVANFPHITSWDPYLIIPTGSGYGSIHFFNYLLAFVIWIGTAGHPSAHAIDVIGVYFPVVLAALTVIPVYFIGKELFNRWAGVIAAGIMAVMPGEFLGRSILGGTDQHVAETLLISLSAMFTIFAIKSAWKNQLSWGHIVKRDWKAIRKPLIFSLLAGLFLGIYMLTWMGALIFVFIFAVYLVIQFIIDHLRGQSSFYLAFTAFFVSLVTLLLFVPGTNLRTHNIALVVLLVFPLALAWLSRFMAGRKLKSFYYPAALAVLGGLFILVFWLVTPATFHAMMNQLASVFNPGGPTSATTIEMQPFLSPNGSFTIAIAWGNFTTSMFLSSSVPIPGIAIISLVLLIVFFIKNRGEDKQILLFFIWSLVILIATLAQRRFAYYLVVNMALLSGYLCWQAIRWLSKKQFRLENPETLQEQYLRSSLVGVAGGALIFGLSRWIMGTDYFFYPVYILGILSIVFGYMAWIRLTLKSTRYRRAAFWSIFIGIIAFGLSFLMTANKFFFVPVFIMGLLSIFYGFWAWVRAKNLNEYMILWSFLFPIGIVMVAFSKDKTVKSKTAKAAKVQPVVQLYEKPNRWFYTANVAVLIVIVFAAVIWPNWQKGVGVASTATYAPSDGWEEAMHWMKANTPEPMPDGSYYKLYDVPAGGSYVYPDTAYGVTTWWDYGYWITRTAHRIPSDNPSQSPAPIKKVANLLLSTDQQQERDIVKELRSAYIALDDTLTTSKLWAIGTWAGKATDAYTSIFYYSDANSQVTPIEVYNLEYYKLLSVRLYNFDGQASSGERPMVLTWEEKTTTSGMRIKLVSDAQEFDSYKAALQYVSNNSDKNLFLCGSSPFVNPIPIEAVTDYTAVFNSTQQTSTSQDTTTSSVKVYQYTGD